MPRYLNTEQRMIVIKFLVLKDILKKTIDTWSSLKYSKNMMKYLKTAHTFLDKSLEELLFEIGYNEALKLKEVANDTIIQFSSKSKRKFINNNKVKHSIDHVITDSETVYDIMEAVIEQKCKKCNGKKKECNIRDNFMIPWEAPPVNEYVTDLSEACPFAYDEDVEVIREEKVYKPYMRG